MSHVTVLGPASQSQDSAGAYAHICSRTEILSSPGRGPSPSHLHKPEAPSKFQLPRNTGSRRGLGLRGQTVDTVASPRAPNSACAERWPQRWGYATAQQLLTSHTQASVLAWSFPLLSSGVHVCPP